MTNMSEYNMTISVVVLFCNQEDTVNRCLESLLDQTCPFDEIICVDDHSKDHTFSRLRDYEKNHPVIKVIRLEENSSENVARKTGALLSGGDYTLFVDGDDSIDSSTCALLKQEIRNDPVDILHFNAQVINCIDCTEETLQNLIRYLTPWSSYLKNRDIVEKCFLSCQYPHNMWGKLFNTKLLKQAFPYVEEISLPYAADLYQYFIISSLASSYRGINLPLYQYYYSEKLDADRYEKICRGLRAAEAAKRYALSTESEDLISIADRILSRYASECITRISQHFQGGWGNGLAIIEQYYAMHEEQLQNALSETTSNLQKMEDQMKRRTSEITGMVNQIMDRYAYDWRAAFRTIRDSQLLVSEKKEIRTIASFFYKLNSGGTERVMANLAGIWRGLGYRVVLFLEEPESKDDYDVPEGTERVVLPSSWNYLTRARRAEIFRQGLIDHQVDLLIYHAWASPILMWDLLMCKANHVQFAVHCHNIFSQIAIYDPVLSANLPYAYALADGVITLSKTDTAYWSTFNDTVFQTVNPIHYQSVEEIPQAALNGKNIIWCQRFSPEKHPEDVIEIFQKVHLEIPDAHLMILGRGEDPSYEEQIQKMVQNLGLDTAVTFYGYQKNVEDYYQQADLCLLTSDFEGFPMGMIESMGAGVPVILYDLPYLTLVEKGLGIVTVPDHNKDRMADEIISLLRDEEKKKTLGKEARESIREMLRFDYPGEWQKFFDRIQTCEHTVKEPPILWDTMLTHYRMGVHHGDPRGYQIDEILNSRSYRWGRALTLVPRWIRHILTGDPM